MKKLRIACQRLVMQRDVRLQDVAHRHAIRGACVVALIGLAALACKDSDASGITHPLDDLLGSARADARAVTLAVGDSQMVTITARTLSGTIIDDAPIPVFLSSDKTRVQVSPTGVIRAIKVTAANPVSVIVSMAKDNVLQRDTILVRVTATQQAPVSLSIQPSDSARFGVDKTKTVTAVYKQSDSTPATGIATRFWVKPNQGVTVGASTGVLTSSVLGTFWVYAAATAYGVTLMDSVQYTFLNPTYQSLTWYDGPLRVVGGRTMTLQPGGTCELVNYSPQDTLIVRLRGPGPIIGADTTTDGFEVVLLPGSLLGGGFKIPKRMPLKFQTAGSYSWTVAGDSSWHGVVIVR